MAKLKYHQKTFDLLELAPLPSDANRHFLEKAARAAGHCLPVSVIEWLSLENGIPLLRRSAGSDFSLSLRALSENLQSTPDGKKQRLPFMRTKAGVCWAFELTAEPDPPVLVRIVDEEGQESWRTTADRFSDFVFGWIWDRPVGGLTAKAQMGCTLKQIRRLADGAVELPVSRAWPTHKSFRFQVGDGRLRVHYQPDSWSEIVLWASTDKSLGQLAAHVSSAGVPAKALFSEQPEVHRLLTARRRSTH